MPAFSVRTTVVSPSPAALQAQVEQSLRFLEPRVTRERVGDVLEIQLTVIAEDPDAADDYARARLARAAETPDHLAMRLTESEVAPHLIAVD